MLGCWVLRIWFRIPYVVTILVSITFLFDPSECRLNKTPNGVDKDRVLCRSVAVAPEVAGEYQLLGDSRGGRTCTSRASRGIVSIHHSTNTPIQPRSNLSCDERGYIRE